LGQHAWMDDSRIRRQIEEHFAAPQGLDATPEDQELSAAIYADDAVVEFPQGGERIRGRENILAFRSAYPARLKLEVSRTAGGGDLWINEYTIQYGDGVPMMVAGIMEFEDGKVFRERIYITEPWDPPAWRSKWVELME
jgi:SnoaL-like domain